MAKHYRKRTRIMSGILIVVLALFGLRLFQFQVISASKYSTEAANYRTRTVVLKAARGEIVDCYGRPIATNRSGYDIVFNRAYMTPDNMNATIYRLIRIFSENGCEWNDSVPLTAAEPYEFTDDASAVAVMKAKIPVNSYATAENCFDQMVQKYALQSYDRPTQRLLLGIRYSMERSDFSIKNPFTFANDIPTELMSSLAELRLETVGVDIRVVPYREYDDETIAPHLIGTVGKIDAENWASYKDKGYAYDDYVGKSGVEKAYEEYLKGVDGVLTYTLDNKGNILSSEITRAPKQGNTVVLTLDKRLQAFAQQAVLDNIEYNLETYSFDITGSAVIVVNVNTGRVLTAVNYPSFTMDQYKNHYAELVADPALPLFDRAFNGTYAPGSVFKMAMACAALEEGVTNSGEIIDCVKKYTRYEGYQPNCLHLHGPLDISHAIGFSCNYFFFEMGYRLGITKMNQYCRMFGLGEPTGIELPEKTGILAGPEYSESIGESWVPGATLAAAIGQQNNAFTPLQLVMYGATIANGGTRYKATLLKEVRDYETGEVILSNEPTVLNKVEMKQSTLDAIRLGMRTVVTDGTAAPYFVDYDIVTAGKTGTAQTVGADNTFYLGIAPYENTEIAVFVVSEHGEGSTSTVPLVKEIFTEYFFHSLDATEPTPTDTVLP